MEKEFRNPSGYWSHTGPFSIELTIDAPRHIIPQIPEISIEGNTVTFTEGGVGQSMGGIGVHVAGRDLHWRYRDMKAVRNGKGELLWKNRDYK